MSLLIDPITIIIILFVLFAWSRAILRFRERAISYKEFASWSIIWILVLLLSVFRKYLGFLTKFTSLERSIDVILIGSIILLFYLLFRIYVKIDKMDQDTTKIVRELAIRKGKDRKRKGGSEFH